MFHTLKSRKTFETNTIDMKCIILILLISMFCRRFNVEQFDYGAVCSKMAKICAGMSGREISKLGVSWQAAVYASENGLLTEKMVLDRCEAAAKQHQQKVNLWKYKFRIDKQ